MPSTTIGNDPLRVLYAIENEIPYDIVRYLGETPEPDLSKSAQRNVFKKFVEYFTPDSFLGLCIGRSYSLRNPYYLENLLRIFEKGELNKHIRLPHYSKWISTLKTLHAISKEALRITRQRKHSNPADADEEFCEEAVMKNEKFPYIDSGDPGFAKFLTVEHDQVSEFSIRSNLISRDTPDSADIDVNLFSFDPVHSPTWLKLHTGTIRKNGQDVKHALNLLLRHHHWADLKYESIQFMVDSDDVLPEDTDVRGSSYLLSLALSFLSVSVNIPLPDSLIATGHVQEDGSVLNVEAIPEKVRYAIKHYKTLVIPSASEAEAKKELDLLRSTSDFNTLDRIENFRLIPVESLDDMVNKLESEKICQFFQTLSFPPICEFFYMLGFPMSVAWKIFYGNSHPVKNPFHVDELNHPHRRLMRIMPGLYSILLLLTTVSFYIYQYPNLRNSVPERWGAVMVVTLSALFTSIWSLSSTGRNVELGKKHLLFSSFIESFSFLFILIPMSSWSIDSSPQGLGWNPPPSTVSPIFDIIYKSLIYLAFWIVIISWTFSSGVEVRLLYAKRFRMTNARTSRFSPFATYEHTSFPTWSPGFLFVLIVPVLILLIYMNFQWYLTLLSFGTVKSIVDLSNPTRVAIVALGLGRDVLMAIMAVILLRALEKVKQY